VVPTRPLSHRAWNWVLWFVVFALLAWSWAPAEMFRVSALFTDWRNMAEFGNAFLKPNFHDWDNYLSDMLITIQIALWGTALAVFFGIPFSILGSANICPQWIVQPVRRLMDACRAINEIVFALMFVVAVGLGPFAGVMALFVHNLGVFSKLFSEAVEAIDPRPIEGIRATGARRLQEVIFGVIPQVVPLWSSLTLYRLETNVRSATTLGIVGAGGIGQTLYESIRSFQYAQTAAQVIIVVAAVMAIDLLSARLRKALI
jgi:phosphonate transport system permease protein